MVDGDDQATEQQNSTTRTYQNVIFGIALIAGTASTILSKTLLQSHGKIHSSDDETHVFAKPLALALGMFVGMMLAGLPLHWIVVKCKIRMFGYTHVHAIAGNVVVTDDGETSPLLPRDLNPNQVPSWMYFYMGLPGVFDLLSTALALVGLLYVNVSAYQLLRATGLVFTTLLQQNLFADRFYYFQWLGVGWNVFAIFLVALASVLNATLDPEIKTGTSLAGIALLLLSTLVQSLQLVSEERIMRDDAPHAPPLLLLGMEGLWGTLICLGVLYPVATWIPGNDQGSLENPFSAWSMIMNTPSIKIMFAFYVLSVVVFNLLALLLTVSLSSTWQCILNNVRLPVVWATSLVLYYTMHGQAGEPWTGYSWLQLLGLFALIYGTLLFNAPDRPSIRLEGQWYAFGINLTPEYAEIELQRNPAVPGVVKWLGSALGRRLKFG